MRELLNLMMLFAKVGLFTFGGGYAMLPLLKSEVVERRRFLSEEELIDLYSIGQCTPGIIAVNVASFIGYRQKGVWGAVFATLGMILPSLLVIMIIAAVLKQYMHNRYVAYALAGVRICVVALIVDVVYELWRKNIKQIYDAVVFVLAIGLLYFCNLSAVWIVLFAAGFALFWYEMKQWRKK